MVILHIASIENDPYSGVAAAVPKMVLGQAEFTDAQIGFVNVRGIEIDSLNSGSHTSDLQLSFDAGTGIEGLKKPFNRPDIVVFHEVYYPPFLKLAKECKRLGIPYVVVPHGCLTDKAQHIKRLKKVLGNMLLFNSYINGAAALQFLSEAEAKNSHFGQKRFIGTNGVKHYPSSVSCTDSFPPGGSLDHSSATSVAASHQGEAGDGRISFLFIGRIDMYIKGLDILVEAIASEAEFLRGNECVFELYGPDCGGSKQKLLNMINDRQLQDLICIHDPITGLVKENKLLESDIFVQSSRSEGMPTGILEAMSYGLPCVLSEGTGLAGIVEKYDAGWTAAGQEASGLAQAIRRAVEETAYYDRESYFRKSENTIRLVKENYSIETVSKNTVEKYRKLIN